MAGAKVTLTLYPDADCAALARKEQLSTAQEEELKSCKRELPAIKADRGGRYSFAEPAPGWYQLSVVWSLGERPSELGLLSMHFRDGFFTMLGESKDTPGAYIGVGSQEEPFEFAGTKDVVVDFDYNKPDDS